MSCHKNEESRPPPSNPNPWPSLPPEMWSSPYPSSVCMQCQERSVIPPVLPSAPYLVTPDLEDVSYPICRLMSPEIGGDGKQVAWSGHFSPNTTARKVDVTPAGYRELARTQEATIIPLEAENEEKKSPRIQSTMENPNPTSGVDMDDLPPSYASVVGSQSQFYGHVLLPPVPSAPTYPVQEPMAMAMPMPMPMPMHPEDLRPMAGIGWKSADNSSTLEDSPSHIAPAMVQPVNGESSDVPAVHTRPMLSICCSVIVFVVIGIVVVISQMIRKMAAKD